MSESTVFYRGSDDESVYRESTPAGLVVAFERPDRHRYSHVLSDEESIAAYMASEGYERSDLLEQIGDTATDALS